MRIDAFIAKLPHRQMTSLFEILCLSRTLGNVNITYWTCKAHVLVKRPSFNPTSTKLLVAEACSKDTTNAANVTATSRYTA